MLIRAAEVEGRGPLDVRLAGGRIAALGPALERLPDEPLIEARGGALLAGLHDHHLHLHSLAAQAGSIPCGPGDVEGPTELAARLRDAAENETGWVRATAYHESVAGLLGRTELDAWLPDRPLRLQHRSGALWILNSPALEALGAEADGPAGLERDASGRPTGRLYREDAWLRQRLGGSPPPLAAVGRQLAAWGVTGVTDAGVDNDAHTLARLESAHASGDLPQRLRVMGRADLPQPSVPGVERGAVKALLDEPRLPHLDTFCERIGAAHDSGRGFAVHCVTRTELVFAVEAFRQAGARPGDRLEHASVAPPELVALVAGLPLTVVTQPVFIHERGDAYRRDVPDADQPWLYRARGWIEAGVPLAAGSDAPYASADPWRGIRAAVERRTADGAHLGPAERLDAEEALALYTTPADAPGGAPRRVAVDQPADLCLLDRPWASARERLSSEDVAAAFCAGHLVHRRGGETP